MWVVWQRDPEQWIHIMPAPFSVRGVIDPARLGRAVAAVGRAYPQLRGRVVVGARGPVLDWSDAPGIPVRESTTSLPREKAVRRAWQVPFDLRRGPLARVDLLHGPDYMVLLLAVHHLVYDGASVLILADALRRAYTGEALPADDPVPALRAFADRSRELADTQAGDAHRAYWRRALGTDTPRPLLPRRVDGSVGEPAYTTLGERLPSGLVTRLRSRAAELGVSYVTVLLGAYYALLHRCSGASDLLVFLPFHGRTDEAVRERVGCFVNTLPIRVEVDERDTHADLLARVRGRVKDGMRHGDLPLPAVMRAAGLTGPEAHARTHQTVFQYWNTGSRQGVDLQALRLEAVGSSALLSLLEVESSAGFPLALMVREDSTGTHVLWKDPAGVVGPAQVSAMAAGYREVLETIAADPHTQLSAPSTDPGVPEPSPEPGERSGPPRTEPARPAQADRPAVHPRELAEMRQVWEDTLGIDDIDEQDSFFELGGHSLLAERLTLAVSKRFGREVPIRVLFDHPRLSDFAAAVCAAAPERSAAPVPQTFPASAFQQRVWLAEQLEPGRGAYNVPMAWRVAGGGLDPAALEGALARLVERHEIFRTAFHERDGEPLQVVLPPWTPEVDRVDLGDEADPERALDDWLHEASQHEFDLVSGRLLIAALVETGSGQVLFLCVHHLLWDGESTAILLKELAAHYTLLAPADGTGQGGASSTALKARAAWLRPAAEPLELPGLRPRGRGLPVQGYEEETVAFAVPQERAVCEAAERLGIGPRDVLLAAFAALVGWYTGRQDLLVGVAHGARPSSNRHMVGPRTDVLPVRLRPEVAEDFATLAARTAAELTEAAAHAQAPADELMRLVDPSRADRTAPLSQVLFAYDDGGYEGHDHGPGSEAPGSHAICANHDVALLLRRRAGEFEGRLVFDGRCFDHDRMRTMAEHYRRLLGQLIETPRRAVGAADPLTETERYTQLAVWNGTETDYPRIPVHEVIRQRALARPHAVAVTANRTALTYRELLADAEATARGLRAAGVRSGELVALVLPRGPEQVRTILAVLLTGAAYVPVDPAVPAQRLEFVLADSGARWAVVPDEPAVPHPGLAGFGGQVLRGSRLPESGEDDTPLPDVPLDSPAYCIYTSGTTGRPKGVVISHRNLIRLLHNDRFPFSFGPSDVWTVFHSATFDVSVWELLGALSHGGRAVLVSEEQAKDPALLWELVQRERVTVLCQTPSAFRGLLQAEQRAAAAPHALRCVIFAGEALRPAMLKTWADRYPQVQLVNMYGPTETTVYASIHTVTRADMDADASVIGSPLPTTTLLLLDRHTGRRLLPAGAVGEIYIGGAGVAEGYLNRPELTRERFVVSPVGPGRLFRSGDLASYGPDGALRFHGRADAQLKLRGYRIEPAEVETCLRRHPAVADAVVFAQDDRLAAVVQSTDPPPVEALRAHLAATLPDYMLPSLFKTVTHMPLTPQGKLDLKALKNLKALREPEASDTRTAAHEDGSDRARPLTPTAAALAEIWKALLGVSPIGSDDSFFLLGGHSMLAFQLVDRIGERFALTLTVRAVFEHPRLRDLAGLLDRELATRADAIPDGTQDVPVPVPAVPAGAGWPAAGGFQRSIWLAEQLKGRGRHNVSMAWKTSGRLDAEQLEEAFALLVEGHELLRTAFVAEADVLRQVVNEPWRPEIEKLDLRTSQDPDGELTRRLHEMAAHPFDPATGRLLRVALADLAADRQALLVCVHHLAIDGESVPVLLDELERCHRAVHRGERPEPPALQYRDFTAAQEALRDTPRYRADLAYWRERLVGAPARTDLPAPTRTEPDGVVRVPLPAGMARTLRPLLTEHQATPFMAFGAALALALHRWTGQRSLTFGVPMTIRDRARFRNLLGPCLDTVVLRLDIGPEGEAPDAFSTALRAVRRQLLAAREHSAAPFGDVLDLLRPERAAGRTPYVDVMLNMDPRPGTPPVLGGADLEPYVPDSLLAHAPKFSLVLTVTEREGEHAALLSYRGDQVSRAEARELAHDVARLLTRPAGERPSLTTAAVPSPGRAELPPQPVAQYREFTAAQEALRGTPRHRADLAYWQQQLAGAPVHTDFPAPARPEPNGLVEIPLPARLLETLRPLLARHSVTPYMAALTALTAVLHRWSAANDVVICTEMSNRDAPGFANVLGPCQNTVVLRSLIEEGTTFLDALCASRSQVLAAFEHAWTPFDEVVHLLNPPRQPGRTPYSDVSLEFAPAGGRRSAVGGRSLHAIDIGRAGAGFLGKTGITVSLALDGEQMSGRIAYRGDRHRRRDMEQLATAFGRTLGSLTDQLTNPVAGPDLSIPHAMEPDFTGPDAIRPDVRVTIFPAPDPHGQRSTFAAEPSRTPSPDRQRRG
ncbi:hypothetical protein GCM10010377_22850 [Streptomyces viridiviolaceus]|nr:hypothetical protein GCM10010377_22850 [Streptomyces viridiviolaceus]